MPAQQTRKSGVGEVEAMFNNDFRQYTPIDPASFADIPWYWHFGVNLSRLLAPIL